MGYGHTGLLRCASRPPLGDREPRDLLEVIEGRYARKATLIASQLPVEHWHDLIGDPTFGDAILDRLVHGAHRITLKGRSMRKADAEKKKPKDTETKEGTN